MVDKHPPRQLALLELLLSAGLRTTDPQLRPWLDERVRASIQQRGACQARIELRCDRCGRIQRRRLRCGPGCAGCQGQSIARARVASRVAAAMPHVVTRHVVVNFPASVVSALASGRLTARETQQIFEQVLFEALDQRARARFGLTRRAKLGFGAASIVHPFTNDLRFSPHLHALVIDGTFIREDDVVRFEQNSDAPSSGWLSAVAAELAGRLQRATRSHTTTPPSLIELRRAACTPPTAAPKRAQRGRAKRGGLDVTASRAARSRGVRIHVSEQIAASDHHQRRRVLDYLGRSPLDPDRVAVRSDRCVHVELPRARRDGAEAIELPADELARRVAALGSLAEPGVLRQHGVLARRAARQWGLEAEQLGLLTVEDIGEDVRATRRRRATPHSNSKCHHCGGRLVPRVVEVARARGVMDDHPTPRCTATTQVSCCAGCRPPVTSRT